MVMTGSRSNSGADPETAERVKQLADSVRSRVEPTMVRQKHGGEPKSKLHLGLRTTSPARTWGVRELPPPFFSSRMTREMSSGVGMTTTGTGLFLPAKSETP